MATAIQPRLIEGPGMGLVRHLDPRHVPDQAWLNGRNIRFPTGGSRIQKTDGFSQLDNTPGNEPIRALWHYVAPTGDEEFVRITTNHVYGRYGSVTFEINDVNWPTATLDDIVTVVGYTDYMIWADGKTRVMRWNVVGKASTLFPGELPNGKIVEMHKDHLLLANITEPGAGITTPQPWRVMYSVETDPRDMTGDNAGFIDFLDDNLPITCVKVLGDVAIVHKPNRVYRMVSVGPPNIYLPEGIPSDDGAISARAAITVGPHQYYMGKTNFYRLGGFPEPIGDAIWPEIANTINWDFAFRTYVYRRYEFDEICWRIIQKDGNHLSACYNFRDQTWTLTDHSGAECFGEFKPSILRHLNSQSNIIEVFGDALGKLMWYDGSPNANGSKIHAWAESKHFSDGLLPAKVLAVACYATGQGPLHIACRAAMEARQPMPDWPALRPLLWLDPSQTRPWVDVREYGRVWQIRIESDWLDSRWDVNAYGPAVIPGTFAR